MVGIYNTTIYKAKFCYVGDGASVIGTLPFKKY